MNGQNIEAHKWAVIGPGNVGSELINQIGKDYVAERIQLEQEPMFIIGSKGITEADGQPHPDFETLDDMKVLPEVTFITIPTYDDGVIATKYISTIVERGGLVVTAEKGALANNFSQLKDISKGFTRLGINATVGGGTRLLDVAKIWCGDPENITEIHLALNGTLSAIMSMVGTREASPISLNRAVEQSVKLEYAEPGAKDPYEVIRGEVLGDIPKKTAIFFNALELGDEILDFRDLKIDLTKKHIREAYEQAQVRRFIVSLYSPKSSGPEGEIISGFDVEHAGWRIVSGFRNLTRNPLFGDIGRISGPGSGLVVGLGPNESDGIYSMTGDGAGVSPTANAMIDDFISKSGRKIQHHS